MLAHMAQAADGPAVDSAANRGEPAERSTADCSAFGRSPQAGHLHDTPVSMRAPGDAADVAAGAGGDGIETLADLLEEGSESALRPGRGAPRSGDAGAVAPCMTAMRARGLRQQRVSRESRRESAVLNLDLAVLRGGAGLGGHGGAAEAGRAGGGVGGRGNGAGGRDRVGSPGVGGPSGGAGAVLVRQRMQKRLPRVSGESGLHCEVVFGEELGRGA